MSDAEIFLQTLFSTIAAEHGYNSDDVNLKAISSDGANYTSQLFVATISTPGKPDLKLFAKVAIISEDMRKLLPVSRLYTVERHFYTKLINFYQQMEVDHDVPQEHRLLVPKCYVCDATYLKESVVLENLAEKGYTMHDRFKSVDWEYASRSVEELAKLHALSFAYALEYPEEFKQSTEELVYDISREHNENTSETWKNMVSNAINVVNDINKEKITKYVTENVNLEKMQRFYKALKHPVLTHGDFRTSNLMHRKNENGKMELIVLDYQTLHTGCPVVDLIYFIFTSSDEEFRSRYYHKLVEYYYEQLCQALQRFQLEPQEVYPREDYDYELKEMLPFALHVGLFTLQIVTVEAANAPKISEDLSEIGNIQTSDIFAERLNGIVNDLVKWGII